MAERADVVIVGGGIIGCLTAYYLTQRGIMPTLFEADAIASGASGMSAGILTPYSGSCDPDLLALSPATLSLHAELAEQLPEETGVDYGYHLKPHLRCALTEDDVVILRQWQADRASEGAEVEWISPEEARSMTDWLTADILGALKCEIEPTLDSYRLTLAVAQAAEARGARIMTGRVVDIVSNTPGRADAVKLENGGEVAAGVVVLAMGPWALHASDWLNFRVPVRPQKGQMLHLADDPSLGPKPEVSFAVAGHGVVLPKRLSPTILGATREDVGFDRTPTPEARQEIIEGTLRLSTRLADAPIADHTACLRPMPEDGRPYIGPVPGWDNVMLATGHWSEGIHFGPVTGRWLADMIADGKSQYDLSSLSPGRTLA